MNPFKIIKNKIQNRRKDSGSGYRDTAAVLLFIFLLPYIVSFFFGNAGMGVAGSSEEAAAEGEETTEKRAEMALLEEDLSETGMMVYHVTEAGTERMPLEAYLAGRLAVTIPMEYEMETLKAQAVVLRTELVRLYYEARERGEKTEEDGRPCVYVEGERRQADEDAYEKCLEAVRDTKGMYMVYEGYPVYAPYFAVSAGTTRNGNEVLGSREYNYLKSVMCERDFTSEDYVHSQQLGRDLFLLRLKEGNPQMEWQEGVSLEEAFSVSRDMAGYVMEISSGEERISGERFRRIFSLPSACFELEEEGGRVRIKTKGVGHGLGFCQYGANEAAKKGSDFIDILNYFFTGIGMEKLP